jgi:KamA family protein
MLSTARKFQVFTQRDLESIPHLHFLSPHERFELEVVSRVLPFKVNSYLLDELIDWDKAPDDPIYNLVFLKRNMLPEADFNTMANAVKRGDSQAAIQDLAHRIRLKLNPHPAGQMTANVPMFEDAEVPGLQHKYRETCLVFPAHGQTCHAYCSFCFRWAQFVGNDDLQFATDAAKTFQAYLRAHPEVTDVLFTGGDPMTMSTNVLRAYIQPLLGPEFEHIQSIRIGTKSVAYWPYRFVTDRDSDDLMQLFEEIVNAGKHLAIMGHYNHWKELTTPIARRAVHRIRNTGAVIRTQSPLLRTINDRPETWSTLWQEQVRLGCIPYYMFIERDTGAQNHFSVPIYRAWEIFREAFCHVSGLGRTVRGPSMSAYPGKVAIEGVSTIQGEKVFHLTFLQARNADWCRRPFFAKFDPDAVWFDQLKPAFGEERFFFQSAQ